MPVPMLMLLPCSYPRQKPGHSADSTKVEKPNRNKHPLHRFYGATGTELIFASGDMKVDSFEVENNMRFSLFPHFQQQYHYNFGKGIGFYTGISFINTGFKNILSNDTLNFELRQRSMSFGVPLALKLGHMERELHCIWRHCRNYVSLQIQTLL
jgi:hypothetical protein